MEIQRTEVKAKLKSKIFCKWQEQLAKGKDLESPKEVISRPFVAVARVGDGGLACRRPDRNLPFKPLAHSRAAAMVMA